MFSFARLVADKTGVSIVVAQSLDSRPVSVEVADVEVGELLALVARRMGVELTVSGSSYFIGELRDEDRGLYVRRVKRLDKEGLTQAVGVMLSKIGRVVAYEDGLVVVGDRVGVLHRVAELLDKVEDAEADSWVVQLYVISTRNGEAETLGLHAEPAIEVGVSFAAASAGDYTSATNAAAALTAVLEAERRVEALDLLAAPMFVMSDGEMARVTDGEDVRIPRRNVSDQGTVTTVGFDTIRTGLQVEAKVRDVGAGRARLGINTSMSEVVGFNEGVPIVNQQEFQTRAVVQSGGVYLLGSLQRTRRLDAVDGIFRSVKEEDRQTQKIQVWARTYRIASGIGSE